MRCAAATTATSISNTHTFICTQWSKSLRQANEPYLISVSVSVIYAYFTTSKELTSINQSINQYFISTTNKHEITKNVHEITHEVLTGQVIEERQALCTISTWPT